MSWSKLQWFNFNFNFNLIFHVWYIFYYFFKFKLKHLLGCKSKKCITPINSSTPNSFFCISDGHLIYIFILLGKFSLSIFLIFFLKKNYLFIYLFYLFLNCSFTLNFGYQKELHQRLGFKIGSFVLFKVVVKTIVLKFLVLISLKLDFIQFLKSF